MPVVIKAGSGGVLFHEACGHGLEADLVAKGASVFRGRVGEQVASPFVTLVDDGTMAGEWGAIGIDDEGHPAQRNVLIQDGVLTDYMWDFLRSRKEGHAQCGNGRRQSYQHLPMVRMTNTFVLNGEEDPDDIVKATDHGVYVAQLGGGQVNTATGDFVFGMTEAYLIEDGELTDPIREGNLIGNGPQVLQDIDLLGQRLRHGQPRHVRQGRPGRAGRRRPAHPAGEGPHHRRYCRMSASGAAGASCCTSPSEWPARPSRASRSRRSSGASVETSVRVYEGEIEHLSRPRVEGIGVRVIKDGRVGFAYAGTLDEATRRRGAGRGSRQRRLRHSRRVGRPGRA